MLLNLEGKFITLEGLVEGSTGGVVEITGFPDDPPLKKAFAQYFENSIYEKSFDFPTIIKWEGKGDTFIVKIATLTEEQMEVVFKRIHAILAVLAEEIETINGTNYTEH